MTPEALQEYAARIAARTSTREALDQADARLSYVRLILFFAALAIAILAWVGIAPAWWLLLPAGVFVVVAFRHERVFRDRARVIRAIGFYERGVAKIEDRWRGSGEGGERFRDDRHLYANDLDLFGPGSLFQLLSLARTRAGEATLAGWLTAPAGAEEIRARQAAVQELAPANDLREQMAIAGADVRNSVQTDRLLAWAGSPLPPHRELNALTWGLTAAAVAGIGAVTFTSSAWPITAVVVLQAVLFHRHRAVMNEIVSGTDPEATADFVADALTHRVLDLDVLAGVLRVLERETFQSAELRGLAKTLDAGGRPASQAIRRLHRAAEIHDSYKNAVILPLALFLLGRVELALCLGSLFQLVRPHLALAVARWRTRHSRAVGQWLQTVARFEALSSLAAYRFEHSADPFPEIVAGDDGTGRPAVFDSRQLGHPLLSSSSMVRNDVRLDGLTQLLVVSGSNMSGKSTLLRTVGINAVLALAGAPVRAAALRLSPVAIGATLRIQDSLLEGRSRFYAEITRIRELADAARGPVPLLFLLDELFHGTNSHDRLAGASGVLRSLIDRGAIGLITTHDLALVALADGLSPRAVNVHFEDWFEGDDMRFDYLMKPGPVTHSNALALMRTVGLEVPPG